MSCALPDAGRMIGKLAVGQLIGPKAPPLPEGALEVAEGSQLSAEARKKLTVERLDIFSY